MKSTVKRFLLLGALLCTPFIGISQTEVDNRSEERLQRIAERLELTESQKAELKVVMERHAEKIEAEHAVARETREQMKTELEEILTEEQMAEFNKMMERHHNSNGRLARRGQGHDQAQAEAEHRAEQRLDRLARALDLTEEQQAELAEILEAHKASEEKDREALENRIKAVLTPEQSAKFDEISQRMRHR